MPAGPGLTLSGSFQIAMMLSFCCSQLKRVAVSQITKKSLRSTLITCDRGMKGSDQAAHTMECASDSVIRLGWAWNGYGKNGVRLKNAIDTRAPLA